MARSGAAMRPHTLRRGWCPTAAVPMAAADGMLLRVRPPAGRVTASELRRLARIAREYGNGAVVVTRRAKLELRGIEDGRGAVEALQAAELAPRDPAEQARPDIVGSPASDIDETAVIDIGPAYRALVVALDEWPGVAGLPAKLGIVLDGGGRANVAESDGDLRFDAVRRGGGCGFRVALAGTRSSATPLGVCLPERVPAVATALLARFQTLRSGRENQIWRMRHALAAAGADAFVAAAAGLLDAPATELPFPQLEGDLGSSAGGWYGIAFPFGRLDGTALNRLADVAESQGQGDVRMLPTRVVLLPGVTAEAGGVLREAGAIDQSLDARLRVEACSGLGGCTRATTHTRPDALALAERLPGLLSGERRCVLHVSGCSKGCAHSGRAAVTLTGREGRYDVGVVAQPGEAPLWRALALEEVARRLTALERVLAAESRGGEDAAQALARLDRERLRQCIERELASG